jgi:hypothetical protein
MSNTRLNELSESLHGAVVSKALTHPNHETLNRHIADSVGVRTDRGWRLSKKPTNSPNDAAIALGLAVMRALQRERKPEPRILAVF